MVEQQFHEIPETVYHEPFEKEDGTWTDGGLSVRFQNEYGYVYQYIDLREKKMKLFIPFTGDEKVCWDCGLNRELIVRMNLDGSRPEFDESCDNTPDIHDNQKTKEDEGKA